MGITPKKYDNRRTSFSEIKAPVTTYFLNTSVGVGSTNSAAYVDYPGPLDKIFIKRETATTLLVSGFFGAYKTINTGSAFIAIRINGIDYPVGQYFYNQVGVHQNIPFNVPIATGLSAGTYTARMRWAVAPGDLNKDNNDVVHLRIEEGYYA